MPISEVAAPTHWVELFGKKVLQAEETDSELRGNWTLLRYVMAHNLVTFFGLPEHPIQPLVRDALNNILSQRQKHFTIQEGDEEVFFARIVASRLRDLFPQLCIACEVDELTRWVRSITYNQLSIFATDDESRKVFFEKARVIPLLLSDRFQKYSSGQLRDVGFQAGNLRREFGPSNPVGRPRKQSGDRPANAGERSLDPKLSAHAYQLALDGKNWKDIARAIFPDLTAAARRDRKIEKRVNRLIERGRLNAKKDGRNN